MDIVIPTIRNLDFLEAWRPFLGNSKLIIIKDGDAKRPLVIPEGFSTVVYTHEDIAEILGENSWIISRQDSACRCFGFLMATSDYVYTVDDDCVPLANTTPGRNDAITLHMKNLQSPAHPDYFNTLYDSTFVRGYPFERRKGKPTVVSHGLWLGNPDLDAVTALQNPQFTNDTPHDLTISIPKGVLYPMSGMNLAFDRNNIGPAMYFGLMGDPYPWGRYDDMWAGWCTKKIADHLGFGVKTGQPYIMHKKASDWLKNVEKEKNGLLWQERIISAFEAYTFSQHAIDAATCYLELADFTERELVVLDPYFERLADAMRIWTQVWKQHSR